MTRVKITQLIWDEWNTEHIKKHNVTTIEVEEALANIKIHKLVKDGRILLIGRVQTRILSVILAPEEKNMYYVVTARDAAKKERKQLYEQEDK